LNNIKNKKILEKKHLKVCTQWFVYFLQVMTSYQENKQANSLTSFDNLSRNKA